MWPCCSSSMTQRRPCFGRFSVRSRTCDVLTSRCRTRCSADAPPQVCERASPCPRVVRRRGWSSSRTSAGANIDSYFPVEFMFCLHSGRRHCGHTLYTTNPELHRARVTHTYIVCESSNRRIQSSIRSPCCMAEFYWPNALP